jgi:hypothetical protein
MNTRLSNSLGLHLVLLLLAGFWVTTNSVMSSEPTSAEEKSAVAPVVQKVDPFANTTNPTPPPSVYNGPLFKLSHNYSGVPPAPPVNPPWTTVSPIRIIDRREIDGTGRLTTRGVLVADPSVRAVGH